MDSCQTGLFPPHKSTANHARLPGRCVATILVGNERISLFLLGMRPFFGPENPFGQRTFPTFVQSNCSSTPLASARGFLGVFDRKSFWGMTISQMDRFASDSSNSSRLFQSRVSYTLLEAFFRVVFRCATASRQVSPPTTASADKLQEWLAHPIAAMCSNPVSDTVR